MSPHTPAPLGETSDADRRTRPSWTARLLGARLEIDALAGFALP